MLAGKSASETFGVGADGAGWMPAPPFSPGDRVLPFVDHRVPPDALAGYVSLHDLSSVSTAAMLGR
jgi:hypothetical protein